MWVVYQTLWIVSNFPFYQTFKLDEVREFLIVTLNSAAITPGSDYVIDIDFSGAMDKQIVGLYSSSYMDADGNPR